MGLWGKGCVREKALAWPHRTYLHTWGCELPGWVEKSLLPALQMAVLQRTEVAILGQACDCPLGPGPPTPPRISSGAWL